MQLVAHSMGDVTTLAEREREREGETKEETHTISETLVASI